MNLFPAIDLRDGKVVRLRQGAFSEETVYGHDPVEVARGFADQGAQWVHVVDLDAARTGSPVNRSVIEGIAAAIDIPVQVGGGVRDRPSAQALFATGVERVVVGTIAVTQPNLVIELTREFQGRIVVGLDARGGLVASSGWEEGSQISIVEMVQRYEGFDLAAFVVTDIGRDGMLQGPDLDGLSQMLSLTDTDVVASGGVGTLADLEALGKLRVEDKALAGVIVGKALYEQRFSVAEAVAYCQDRS